MPFLITAEIAGLKGYLHSDGQFRLDREKAQRYASRILACRLVEKLDLPAVTLTVEEDRSARRPAFTTKDRTKAAAFIQYAEDTEGMKFFEATNIRTGGYAVYYTANYDKQVVSAVVRNFNQEWRAFQ